MEIDNIVKAGFADANIPDAAGRPVRFGEGKELSSTRRTPIQKRGVVTLKQGMINSPQFLGWRKLVDQGKMENAKKTITVTLIDKEGKTAAK